MPIEYDAHRQVRTSETTALGVHSQTSRRHRVAVRYPKPTIFVDVLPFVTSYDLMLSPNTSLKSRAVKRRFHLRLGSPIHIHRSENVFACDPW